MYRFSLPQIAWSLNKAYSFFGYFFQNDLYRIMQSNMFAHRMTNEITGDARCARALEEQARIRSSGTPDRSWSTPCTR